MLNISKLIIYPVKSLGGIELGTAKISATGFAYDRYWMLVGENGKCITQREIPVLSVFRLTLLEEAIVIRYKNQEIKVSKTIDSQVEINCKIHRKDVIAIKENQDVSDWFSRILNKKVLFVRTSPSHKRLVKDNPESFINFPDNSQYLIIGESSLNNLNEKIQVPLPINRFRPNIVFSGGAPHIEDNWQTIQIGDAAFEVTKACARCKITTINQDNGTVGIEPLLTLRNIADSIEKFILANT